MTEATHMCFACAAGLYSECSQPVRRMGDPEDMIVPCIVKFTNGAIPIKADGPGRPVQTPEEIKDPTSTGRKRAAMVAPILTGQICAWAGLKFAGGGPIPIVGCDGHALIERKGGAPEKDLYQGDRHHGPDKNTLNNAVGMNLHSICADCHHRWHALNDEFYDKDGRPSAAFPFTPVVPYFLHDPVTRSTELQHAIAEDWWSLPKKDRGDYPFAPDDALKVLPTTAASATLDPGDNPFPTSPFAEIGD